MSSPLFSALAKLDESLQDVQIQVDWLRAGIEVGDDDFHRSLSDAHQSALNVRDLIHAERPNASWSDRNALEQLMHDLEREAQIRVVEQRRSRLMNVASELDAGSVRHRFESRAASLNSLRLDAVRELRVLAALPNQDKELPGPDAEWLHWACNLPEESYSNVFEELRQNFPALEAFAVEMEESYWAPGEGSANSGANAGSRAPEPAPASRDRQVQSVPVISDYRKPPHNVRVPADVAVKSGGGMAAAVALGYEAQMSAGAAAAPALAETPWAVEQTWENPSAMETSEEVEAPPAPPLQICEKCGATYSTAFHACAVDQSTLQMAAQALPAVKTPASHPTNGKNGSNGNGSAAITPDHYESIVESAKELSSAPAVADPAEEASSTDPTRETAEKEFHRLRAIVEQRTQDPEEEERAGLNLSKTQIIAIVVAMCALMAVTITMVVRYYGAKSEAAAAAAAAAVKVPPVVSDADLQKQIEQKLTALKGSTIEVAVQSGVVTLSGHSSSEEETVQADDMSLQTTGVKVIRDRIQVDGHAASNAKPRAGKTTQQH